MPKWVFNGGDNDIMLIMMKLMLMMMMMIMMVMMVMMKMMVMMMMKAMTRNPLKMQPVHTDQIEHTKPLFGANRPLFAVLKSII